jgi:phosphatidylglycerol:prolipoprotein diacylglycerol transferase
MCSNLFTIPSHVSGIPLFGFGLLFWLAVLAAAAWGAWAANRPGGRRMLTEALPVTVLLLVAIVLLPKFFPGGLPIRGYGLMLVVAAASGLAMATHRARQAGTHPDHIVSLAFWMFVLGIVGGRVFYVVQKWDSQFASLSLHDALLDSVKYANGGLVVYGALIGASLAFVVFLRRRRLPILPMADIVAPSLAVGLAFGRIGCLLHGCCFGGITDSPLGIEFPREGQPVYSPPYEAQLSRGEFYGLRITTDGAGGPLTVEWLDPAMSPAQQGLEVGDVVTHLGGVKVENEHHAAQAFAAALTDVTPLTLTTADGKTIELPPTELPATSRPVHPTQIYASINAALLGWFLWCYYPFRRRDGEVIALLLTLYPMARFLLEMIRTDEGSFLGTQLSISQNVSLILLALMVPAWIWLLRHPSRPTQQLASTTAGA